MTDAWELVRREREALVDDLAGLTDKQWELPSLCGGRTAYDPSRTARQPARRGGRPRRGRTTPARRAPRLPDGDRRACPGPPAQDVGRAGRWQAARGRSA